MKSMSLIVKGWSTAEDITQEVFLFFILYIQIKERKKYGLKGARSEPQFSKR
ncbi:30S ribosomal protein S9 [Bacillus sp. OV322]|uniref:30S ribosomal protein S9 n=1 Tax=Bacillus sp. OV322 TaxID=1882764 RepID=UPI000B880C7A